MTQGAQEVGLAGNACAKMMKTGGVELQWQAGVLAILQADRADHGEHHDGLTEAGSTMHRNDQKGGASKEFTGVQKDGDPGERRPPRSLFSGFALSEPRGA